MTKEEILAKASEFNKGGCEWLDKCIKGSFDDVVGVELHIIDTYEVNKDGKVIAKETFKNEFQNKKLQRSDL